MVFENKIKGIDNNISLFFKYKQHKNANNRVLP